VRGIYLTGIYLTGIYRPNSSDRACSNSAMHSRIFFTNSVGALSTIPFGKRSTRYPLFAIPDHVGDLSGPETRKHVRHHRAQQRVSMTGNGNRQWRCRAALGGQTYNPATGDCGEAPRRASRLAYPSDRVLEHERLRKADLVSLQRLTPSPSPTLGRGEPKPRTFSR
jgi:hypothetical protein